MTRVITGMAGLAAIGASLLLSAQPAPAAPSASTTKLCTNSPVTCSIQVAAVVTEATSTSVAVTGRPGTTVEVELRRVSFTGQAVTAAAAFGPKVRVTTDGNGFGAADLAIPQLPAGEAGGPVLFTLADSTGTGFREQLGTWSLLAATTPEVHGDGYAEQKPVGEPLELHLGAVRAGLAYTVEFTDGPGRTHVVSDPSNQACWQPADTCVIRYTVPRGLSAASYPFRLVEQVSGATVHSWTVQPADDGVPQPRTGVRSLPAVGAGVPGSVTAVTGATSNPVPRPRSENLDVPDIEVGSEVVGARIGETTRGTLLIAGAAATAVALLLTLLAAWRGSRRSLPPRLAREAPGSDG